MKGQFTSWSMGYGRYLEDKNWLRDVIVAIIISYLQEPHSDGKWDRRGLVIGQVQSGKTANYLSLVTKAADAGYKFIIIIAGIHNSLRRQTQQRVEEGFIGRSSHEQNKHQPTGVGVLANLLDGQEHPCPVTLTTVDNDFTKNTAKQSGWKINDFSKPLVVVIKKNTTTLKNLLSWLKGLNAKGDGIIEDIPLLMIDDEADNASINTNDPESDPTKTNAFLRDILSTFAKSGYVGYTATPYANIFIDPDVTHSTVGKDLFPKDFIYWLEPPNSYFGSGKVFIEDEYSSRILMEIDDAENYIPLKHKKYFDFPNGLPPSLYQAINVFILAKAIRELRGQGQEHASMLVNFSYFANVQREAKNLISSHIQDLENAVRLNYKLPDNEALKNDLVLGLYETYQRYVPKTKDLTPSVLWEDLKAVLFKVVESIDLLLINSGSDDVLNYSDYKDGRMVIAVGGFSLSRGLTLEGLCTSYMYRNTRMYDTLMQMGRWFGYRAGYEDLCTVWLNGQSINWYHHIAVATDDLRQQIVHMRQTKCSPKDFGLYVRKSADNLMITAPGKMKSGTNFVMSWNFSGKLKESYILPKCEDINRANRELIKKCFDTGFGAGADKHESACPGGDISKSKGSFIKDVPIQNLINFLEQFTVCDSLEIDKKATIDFLDLISSEYPLGDVLFISMKDNKPDGDLFPLGYQLRPSAADGGTTWKLAKNRVASRNDEKLGLTADQINQAENCMDEDLRKVSDRDYRTVRNKPLLMLHLINFGDASTSIEKMAPAYGISFPMGDFDRAVEIMVNQVWVRQQNEDFGDPESNEVGDE